MGTLYGTSIDTASPLLRSLTDDGRILRQWVVLQLATLPGAYWSAPEVGADVCQLVLRGLTPRQLAAIPGQIEAALAYDQRISAVDVTATTTYTALGEAAVKLAITVYPKSPSLVPFSLTAVASASVINTVTQGS
jgi:hypothetical protein